MLPYTLLSSIVACSFAVTTMTSAFVLKSPTPSASQTFLAVAPRYGPPLSPPSNDENDTTKTQFRQLVQASLATTNPEHLPRLWANHLELIVSLLRQGGAQRIISELVEESKIEDKFEETVNLVDSMFSFAEDFCQQAQEMDSDNKHLLGKIIKAMTNYDNCSNAMNANREEYLDQVLQEEKKKFTPGFLRHLEGECARIANAPQMTPESARFLEVIRVIQTRVLEELGSDMGEAALVLGQLMGYENPKELLGVLEAGLTVRGRDFAVEMAALTEEALDGFSKVPGGVEEGLVERVRSIDNRLREFLEETNEFQQ